MALHLWCCLQWLSFAKFYPLDPPTLDFFADSHWDMSGNLINIYNLRYKIVVLKKNHQSFHKLLFQDPIWAKTKGQQRPCPKSSSVFFVEITRGDHKLSNQKLFISLKYHKFWLSYGWYSVLYDILLPKLAISGWNRHEEKIQFTLIFYLKQNKEVQLDLRLEIFIFSPLLPSLLPGKMLEEKLTYQFSQFGMRVGILELLATYNIYYM